MRHLKHQQGFSLIKVLLIAGIVVFGTLFLFRVVPVYIENYTIKDALSSLQKVPLEASTAIGAKNELRSAMMRRLHINSINRIKRNDIIVKGVQDGYQVSINYQVGVTVIKGIDLKFHFDEQIVVKPSDS